MRLPKRVLINNRPRVVVKDAEASDAGCSYKEMKIRIGTKGNADREVLTGFMHEVAEISSVERGVRSQKCMLQHEANDYVFTASHKQFCDVISDVSGIVGDMMKLK